MSPGTRAIRVTFQAPWDRAPRPRGLLDGDPRVRTLRRVLVSYPEVRYILPDRVSLERTTAPEVLDTVSRFLRRQRWLVRTVEIV